MLVSQYVAPARGGLHCPDPPNVHPILDPQPELLYKHGQVEGVGISWWVKLTAHSLEQQVRVITQ